MQDLDALSLPAVFRALTAGGTLEHLMRLAREEDLDVAGDVTTASVLDGSERGAAAIVA
ncbi:MAG: hypothetical protein HKO59_03750, partial [Phycisphaerales bacterium]|nr:hypothetical protein [Phycisphaerales bacterium]NNM25096.1 hypothetical protein [Phycisphaerales bacterium]